MFALHTNKGKSIAKTITDRTDYAANPDKTRKGELVTGYECSPQTVDAEFLLAKQRYFDRTGRDQGDRNVLAYHIRQAFKPGEITPELANELGRELAMRFTKGKHSFIVATHIDKRHIHNHVVFNSTNLECDGKFRDFKQSGRAIRRISDQICLEYGLSVIENPKPSRGHYGTWLGDKKISNARQTLEALIDKILEVKPTDFEHFINLLEAEGCEYRRDRRSARLPEQKGFVRLKSLSDDYRENAIREKISGNRTVESNKIIIVAPRKLGLLIDVQNSIKAQNSPGYEQWAKIFSLKQAAKTLMFLQDNNLTELDKLNETAQRAKEDFNEIQSNIHAADTRLKEISTLQKHIGQICLYRKNLCMAMGNYGKILRIYDRNTKT